MGLNQHIPWVSLLSKTVDALKDCEKDRARMPLHAAICFMKIGAFWGRGETERRRTKAYVEGIQAGFARNQGELRVRVLPML